MSEKSYKLGFSTFSTILVLLIISTAIVSGYVIFIDSGQSSSFNFPEGMNRSSINNLTEVIMVHHSSLQNKSSYTIETVNSADGGTNYTFKKKGEYLLINERESQGEYNVFIDNEQLLRSEQSKLGEETNYRQYEITEEEKFTAAEYILERVGLLSNYRFQGVEELNGKKVAKYTSKTPRKDFSSLDNIELEGDVYFSQEGIMLSAEIFRVQQNEKKTVSSLNIMNIKETNIEKPEWVENAAQEE